ncbi:hypothetical protein [Pseudomonas sp. NFR16]|uniref:hypothetical protein n=1 Tax=Pseudomonas sp. NFR16 TaxID=1566248 RepID=UPI0008CA82DF|nr:hypothetical protein [Pseudomonas sp. NFR16]SEJ50323.1 hypothetical protein SAMN03159495_3474 [Pseudomonas sp. NFR16]
MRLLILALLLSLASLARADQPQVPIDIQHDSKRSVTCYITVQGGISCLPDSLLQQAAPKPQQNRASPAGATLENGGLLAAPLPQDERLQL